VKGAAVPPAAVEVIAPIRIQRIALTDFRAFPGPAPVAFELDGKNLLVYGENGAGKSSLFHALQDFFSTQPKRSLASHKNIFSKQPDDICKVSVTFVGPVKDTSDWTSSRHPCGLDFKRPVGSWSDYFFRGSDPRVVDAARRSACLDYKSLLETNFKHGNEAINLFDLAVSSLLRDFRVTVEGGTESTMSNLWNTIKQAEKDALTGTRSTQKEQKVRDACVAFNTAFRSALDRLLPKANDVLQALGWHNVLLTGLSSPGVTYQTARTRKDRKLDGLRLQPEISFRGEPLDRPQLFLNEARLSGFALALYLGGRLACVPSTDTQALKLLVLDDVLVGLDHSNRLPVLDLLANLFSEWQIVLLTHDRTWFELTQSHVNETDWTCVEIYEGDAQSAAPHPIVRKTENRPARALLKKARELLTTPYLEAAANYTRQAFEHGVRKGCEIQKVPMRYTVNPAAHQAQDFLDALKIAPKPVSVTQADWTGCLRRIEMFKNVVMNPYSHPSAPNIPKQEIEQAADAVEKFLELVVKK
jgi:hypothetical protein